MSKSKIYSSLRAANVARQQEWSGAHLLDASFRGNELAGEVGEACNVIKKLERERLGINGSRATIDQLAQELADVIICADLIAIMYGIDLDQAVPAKFNDTSLRNDLSTVMAKSCTLGEPAPGRATIWPLPWIDGQQTPTIEKGSEKYFIVAVKRAHNGKTYTLPASYLNHYPLQYEDMCKCDNEEDHERYDGYPTTGWFTYESSHQYDGSLYENLLSAKGDELVAWAEIPACDDLPATRLTAKSDQEKV